MRLISVVIPVFNEYENLQKVFDLTSSVCAQMSYEAEFVFVNDGSSDKTLEILTSFTKKSTSVRIVDFTRNFGKEVAVSAGIAYAKGDAVIIMDADLQHPPTIIPELITQWEAGFDVVVGVRRHMDGERVFRKLGSQLFARLMNKISDSKSPIGVTDFRLLSRRVVSVFNTLQERRRLTRALIDWLGFSTNYVYFDAPDRVGNGGNRYSYFALFKTAFSAIVAHSKILLLVAGYTGLVMTVLSGLLGLFVLVEQLIMGDPLGLKFTGTAMIALVILFANGVMLICLGFIALYIGSIHENVSGRPLFVVRNIIEQEKK